MSEKANIPLVVFYLAEFKVHQAECHFDALLVQINFKGTVVEIDLFHLNHIRIVSLDQVNPFEGPVK